MVARYASLLTSKFQICTTVTGKGLGVAAQITLNKGILL